MIKAILAMDRKKGIGKNNTIPFKFQCDMKHFREMTLFSNVVMGRKTYISIGGNLLNRNNIILTKNISRVKIELMDLFGVEQPCNIVNSLSRIDLKSTLWVIGGSQIYKLFESLIDEYYITEVNNEYDCDTFFINDLSAFDSEIIKEVEEDGVKLTFKRYWRK